MRDKTINAAENAAVISAPVAAYDKEQKKGRKSQLIKLGAITVLTAVVVIMATIAWFTIGDSVSVDGMDVTATDLPFELKTSGSAGLYDSYLDEVDSGFDNADTTEGVQGIKWKLTKNASEMENVYDGDGEPDLTKITNLESDQYGLYPGDSGTLVFYVVPKTSGDISISFTLDVRGYKAKFKSGTFNKTDDALEPVEDETINNYASSHILFFYTDENNIMHPITSDGFSKTLSDETSYTIYWVWPATLKDILNAEITGLDDDAAKEVRREFFEHPENFLKPIGEQVFDDIKVTHSEDTSEEEAAILAKLPTLLGRSYNEYGAMYNDADQAIGDNINYILVQLNAVPSGS